jgi:pyrroloquinoline quinone biosynthesis protein B
VWVRVLGSGAGGGFPQWNCKCPNCAGYRAGRVNAQRRTQSSVALSVNRVQWYVLNASPDIREQIENSPSFYPREGVRDTAIKAVVLTNADIDHTVGLLSLRESQPLRIYSTSRVKEFTLGSNAMFRALMVSTSPCAWEEIKLLESWPLVGVSGDGTGLSVEAFPLPSKVPLYFEGAASPAPGDTIALRILDEHQGSVLVYMPGVREVDAAMGEMIQGATCLLFDGTFWTDDELVGLGISHKTARDMAHMPISGDGGSLMRLAEARVVRKIYIHINNTNPILDEQSDERRQVEASGWEIAFDGMEFEV